MMAPKIISIGIKIAQLVILLAATGVIGFFVKEYHDDLTVNDPELIDPYDIGELGRYEFFLYATSVGAIIAIAGLLVLLTGQHEKHVGAMVAVHALWTLQLLVASALLAKVLTTFKKEIGIGEFKTSACDSLDDADKDYNCNQVTGGVACGILAAILFLVDTLIYFTSYRQSAA